MTSHLRAAKPTPSANPRDSFSVGVDLGGTNLRIGAYAEGIDVLDSVLLPTRLSEGRERVVRDASEAISALAKKNYRGLTFAGVGVGTPGPLELPEGILRNPPNLPGWDNFNLREALESALGFGIEIESDANVAALAECKLGAGAVHGVDSLCMLTLGTGVGNGLVLNGEVWHGSTGMGGEGGHIVVDTGPEAQPCGCGGTGCLEQYASATAVVRIAREMFWSNVPETALALSLMASAGHAGAIGVFEAVGRSLAIGLTALINTLNLPLYVVGGGLAEAWKLFAPAMFRELRQRSYVYRLTEPSDFAALTLERHKTYVLPAKLGSSAGLLGACLLPLESRRVERRGEPS